MPPKRTVTRRARRNTSGRAMPKFLAPEELLAGVAEVAKIADREKVRIVLIGGLAMQHYGSDRLTGDLDFAASDVLDGLPSSGSLTFGGMQSTTSNGVPVDIIVRDDDSQSLYEEVVSTAPMVRRMGVRVATPEHLVAMKLQASRTKDESDLKFLLASGVVDTKKARALIRKHLGSFAAEELDRVVDEVAWEKRSKRR